MFSSHAGSTQLAHAPASFADGRPQAPAEEPARPQLSALAVVEAWGLGYHLGRVLELIEEVSQATDRLAAVEALREAQLLLERGADLVEAGALRVGAAALPAQPTVAEASDARAGERPARTESLEEWEWGTKRRLSRRSALVASAAVPLVAGALYLLVDTL